MKKMVAESLQEYKQIDVNNQINESAKDDLKKFIADPKNKKALIAAYAAQIGKAHGQNLKTSLIKLTDERQLELAKQSLEKMNADPKIEYPWIVKSPETGKFVGTGKRLSGGTPQSM